MTFDVHVVNADDEPVAGVEVSVSYDGGNLPDSAPTERVLTDEDGNAEFETEWFDNEGTIEVFVDGTSYGDYHVEDGGSVTVNYGDDEE